MLFPAESSKDIGESFSKAMSPMNGTSTEVKDRRERRFYESIDVFDVEDPRGDDRNKERSKKLLGG